MNNWGADSMECHCFFFFCEMSKISWQTGNFPVRDDSENHSKDQ